METKINLKKIGVALAAVAASAFVASNLSGCATETAAQNSTAATTQMQASCKGFVASPSPEHMHHRHMHHHKGKHGHKHHSCQGHEAAGKHHGKGHPYKGKGAKCAGATAQ